MKLLIVGGGAREHALAWKLGRESDVDEVICAPGNAGIEARCVPIDVADPKAILRLATDEGVDLTVIGPELPLAAGVADRFAEAERLVFGPVQAAARLESSKAFAKQFMARHSIPTAEFRVCRTEADAMAACEGFGYPVVVKADGLAAGKGVTVAADGVAAQQAIHEALVEGRFGDAGTCLVIEECLVGPEVSLFVICDGRQGVALPSAQDHKRVYDGDDGPNTGGMGAFAPSPLFSETLSEQVMREVVEPVLDGLRQEGAEYRGVLYVGLMLTSDGPKVIEFNARFGDPEAQVVLPMMTTDLSPVLVAAARGDLGDATWRATSDPHVGVVIASGGYPGPHETGFPIRGLAEASALPDIAVFHAGSALRDGQVVTAGGRVLTVVGHGASFEAAIARTYEAVGCIAFSNKHYRTDIGQQALAVRYSTN